MGVSTVYTISGVITNTTQPIIRTESNGLETGCSVFNFFKTQFFHALLDKGMGIQRQKY
jgi:hypothetical protein